MLAAAFFSAGVIDTNVFALTVIIFTLQVVGSPCTFSVIIFGELSQLAFLTHRQWNLMDVGILGSAYCNTLHMSYP